MARVAERLGVEIRTDSPVEEVLFEGRRTVGVRTASGEEKASAIVMNADFARTTASRTWTACLSSAAGRIPAAACR